MNAHLDLEPLLEHIEHNVMPQWVSQKDHRRELRAKGEPFPSSVVEDLDNILELFYEKKYREGLETYIDWLMANGHPMVLEDIELLIEYGNHFGIDAGKLKKLRKVYRLPEK